MIIKTNKILSKIMQKVYCKFMKKIILTLIAVALIAPSVTFAHPGNTDKRGGHTCKTNCAKWGLKYGQYHYHNKKR